MAHKLIRRSGKKSRKNAISKIHAHEVAVAKVAVVDSTSTSKPKKKMPLPPGVIPHPDQSDLTKARLMEFDDECFTAGGIPIPSYMHRAK